MAATALWRRLDVPGHDAARLSAAPAGWRLSGTAVFEHAGLPACLGYALDLDRSWATLAGSVRGFVGDREVSRRVACGPRGWRLDGRPQPALAGLRDLDLGFTPATNLQQLRRLDLAIGEAAELAVAWLDVDAAELAELPQTYRRRDALSYDYAAPTVPYAAVLELATSGFVRSYPGLWQMEG
jgi:uncharacterized protein